MASQMDNFLAVQNNIDQELAVLNDRISSLGQKIFQATNQIENLHLLLQLSVTEGVHNMYTHLHHVIEQKVIQKSQDEADVTQQEDSVVRSSTYVNTKTDKTAVIWTNAFCGFYRAS